jgi:7,8-dihydropterin-6-yl-methyl-4-(beta-D-ribofuranosyl)aminobenzene 5'-phosphate synthase
VRARRGEVRHINRSIFTGSNMLFSKMCGRASPTQFYSRNMDLDRRDLLCAGGAGFVSALVATMWGAAKVARAQTLGRTIPEVDRLSVRIVTDNYVLFFMPSQKLNDFSMERMGPQLNDQPPRKDLLAEFGLSLHVESRRGSEARNILVDFGITPEVLLNNLAILKVDPGSLDALVLSHGHYDHFGGLVGFLAAAKGRLKANTPFFVGGEDCFCTREFGRGGNMGAVDRNALRDADLSLMVSEGPSIVADHGFTSGPIALSSFEKPLVPSKMKAGVVDGFGCFPDRLPPERNSNTFIWDDFQHEIATNFVIRDKGLVVITSCSHRGVVNTVKQAQVVSGVQKVHAIIGGMHLVPPLTEDYIREAVANLKVINPDYIIPAHCTGETFYEIAKAEMPGKVIRSTVGARFTFGA